MSNPHREANISDRFRVIAAVHLFLISDQEILLLMRHNTGYADGMYSVIAGHLEGGEEVLNAACREAHEEAGVEIDPGDLSVAGIMHRQSADGGRIDFFLECRIWGGIPANQESHKCAELRWTRLDALPENVVPYVREAIENYRSGVLYSAFGWT